MAKVKSMRRRLFEEDEEEKKKRDKLVEGMVRSPKRGRRVRPSAGKFKRT